MNNKHFYHFCLLLLFLVCVIRGYAQEQQNVVKVACVGNSITYGSGVENRERDSYPAVLGQLLGKGYEVRNFGVSARHLLMRGELPYMKEQAYKDVLAFKPDIVVVKLGTNDSKPQNWKYGKDFRKDMRRLIKELRGLESKPEIYLCLPAKAYGIQWGINDSVITAGIIPAIKDVARREGLKVIDLHTPTSGMAAHFPDKIHPDKVGAARIAETVYTALTGKVKRHEPQAFPGFKSRWHTGDRYDFKFRGRNATVVVPSKPTPGNPWIWRPAFFDAFAWADMALLDKGFHVAYLDLTDDYANPWSIDMGNRFYQTMTKTYGLSPKVVMEGLSRGGLYSIVWASHNADKVSALYLDAPLSDVFTCLKKIHKDSWQTLLGKWGLTEETLDRFTANPIDRLEPLAKAGVPIFSVCGDSDKSVPIEENMYVVRKRYMDMGGTVEMIIKPGVGHHPHSLENPKPIVDFIMRKQPEYRKFQHYTVRGGLDNSFIKFEKERKGRVAFIGGSITEMEGWKDIIEEQLQQRFPFTDFEFVEAGISSTGSTPGAFRLQNDVLSKGKIDLLFIDGSANDMTNGFNATEQVRGVEGEIRHALEANPETDIVIAHFATDGFLPVYDGGQVPDVILNYERVANHYRIPTVNLAQEIAERIKAGQFTWQEFGYSHPHPAGQAIYAAAIANLLDDMQRNITAKSVRRPHDIPATLLDPYSYTKGEFLPVTQARLGKGWTIVDKWHPDDKYEKRKGFVDVPMLEAKRPGSSLTLSFEGRAIGIFCVCGPSAGTLEYSVDGAPYKRLDTYTSWSHSLYIPWTYMLETELNPGRHTLRLRMSTSKNAASQGTECQIRNFVVNR